MKNLNQIIKKILNEKNEPYKKSKKQKFKAVCNEGTQNLPAYCIGKRMIEQENFERTIFYKDGSEETKYYVSYVFGWDGMGNKIVKGRDARNMGNFSIENILNCTNGRITYGQEDWINIGTNENPIDKNMTEKYDYRIMSPFCKKIKWKEKKNKEYTQTMNRYIDKPRRIKDR
jgi:hypothetical protein